MAERTFLEEITLSPIHLPRAALRFSKEIAYPDLEIDRYLVMLDQLVDWSGRVPSAARRFSSRRGAGGFPFPPVCFRGTRDYEDPRNSYLNEVLDRRLGIDQPVGAVPLHGAAVRPGAAGIGLPGTLSSASGRDRDGTSTRSMRPPAFVVTAPAWWRRRPAWAASFQRNGSGHPGLWDPDPHVEQLAECLSETGKLA
jgi:hypothetical protein